MAPAAKILEDAEAIVEEIERNYRESDFNQKIKLKPERDNALNAYQAARIRLLDEATVVTEEDIVEMQDIREEISQAADTQALLGKIAKFVGFLTKIAV